ncbi:TB2/DP1, HVA22 family-domain-containing protein [Pisolithus thermaeus]|nr:TB2/DP1, HVA22 family-domain-containing protein [Pisolithus croceorrhizus]KAI6160747.1 TB2/DP1, HVA22 family-domain-containing protein [Pisolithus thermaeus]
MFFYLISSLTSSVVAFLYPGYASYKTLSRRPAREEDIERWLMYWSVLGCIVGVEYVAEWLVSWIPMYYFLKTLFLLYLVLPQTQGSSYLYINHLQPFFHSHEAEIDATLASFKARLYAFVQERFRAIWEQVSGALGQTSQSQSSGGLSAATHTGAPPTLADPASGPAQLVVGLWHSYGPSIIASGAALLHQGTASADSWRSPVNSPRLSGAGRQGHTGQHQVGPSSRNSSDSDLRERIGSGRFEEVDVPSDAEGYDAGGRRERGSGSEPTAARPSSWFGMNWSASGKQKSD